MGLWRKNVIVACSIAHPSYSATRATLLVAGSASQPKWPQSGVTGCGTEGPNPASVAERRRGRCRCSNTSPLAHRVDSPESDGRRRPYCVPVPDLSVRPTLTAGPHQGINRRCDAGACPITVLTAHGSGGWGVARPTSPSFSGCHGPIADLESTGWKGRLPSRGAGWQLMNEWFEAEQRIERAQELTESQRWAEALAELEAALAINPKLLIMMDTIRQVKFLAKAIPAIAAADTKRPSTIRVFFPFRSASIPIGTPSTMVTTPLMLKRRPTSVDPTPTT